MKGKPILIEDRFSPAVLYWLAITCWLIAALIAVLRAAHVVPNNLSVVAILALGTAVFFSLSLGRRVQTDSITEIFSTGLHAALTIRKSAVARLKKLHTESYEDGGTVCAECSKPFPCPTRQVLDQLGNELTAELQHRTGPSI